MKPKEFDNILEECLERLLIGSETLENCLARYPGLASELKPLLETALVAKRAATLQPRPEFKAQARYQFRTALQQIKPKKKAFTWLWQPRWATVAAVALALILAGGGTVTASSGSLPNQPLYPVKLATEQVQLRLARSNVTKAELYARLADRRVAEMERLANRIKPGVKPEAIEQATQRLDNYLERITVLAAAQRVAPTLKAPVPAPAPTPPPGEGENKEKLVSPGAKEKAELRMLVGLYKTAPESARPALMQAIALSAMRYAKAVKAVQE